MAINGIRLVNLADYGFAVDPRYFKNGWTNSPYVYGRDSAVAALLVAKHLLPRGWNFLIWDMHRSREVQIRMILSFRDRIRQEQTDWTELQVMRRVYRFAARAKRQVTRPDCHRNGGAVDLTILDRFGTPLDMGTDHDDLTEKARAGYFQDRAGATALDSQIARNRFLLQSVMVEAGFDPLPSEWWHYSTCR